MCVCVWRCRFHLYTFIAYAYAYTGTRTLEQRNLKPSFVWPPYHGRKKLYEKQANIFARLISDRIVDALLEIFSMFSNSLHTNGQESVDRASGSVCIYQPARAPQSHRIKPMQMTHTEKSLPVWGVCRQCNIIDTNHFHAVHHIVYFAGWSRLFEWEFSPYKLVGMKETIKSREMQLNFGYDDNTCIRYDLDSLTTKHYQCV